MWINRSVPSELQMQRSSSVLWKMFGRFVIWYIKNWGVNLRAAWERKMECSAVHWMQLSLGFQRTICIYSAARWITEIDSRCTGEHFGYSSIKPYSAWMQWWMNIDDPSISKLNFNIVSKIMSRKRKWKTINQQHPPDPYKQIGNIHLAFIAIHSHVV